MKLPPFSSVAPMAPPARMPLPSSCQSAPPELVPSGPHPLPVRAPFGPDQTTNAPGRTGNDRNQRKMNSEPIRLPASVIMASNRRLQAAITTVRLLGRTAGTMAEVYDARNARQRLRD